MLLILDKNSLFQTFGVSDFDSLDKNIQRMAPSMVEYYLSDLSSENEDVYLNKKNIQETISIGEYSIYLDYDEEIYLEIADFLEDDFETGSLW